MKTLTYYLNTQKTGRRVTELLITLAEIPLRGQPISFGWQLLLCSTTLAGVILAFLYNDDNRKTWRILYASLPFALHVAALTTAHRSQNVQERFYAPEIAAILAVSMLFLQYSYQTTKRATWVSIVVIACLLTFAGQAGATKEFVADLQGRDKGKFSKSAYINIFPEILDAATPDSTVVALTEAGRMAYWLEGHHIDLVGLNTPATAVNPVTPGFIERKNPDHYLLTQQEGLQGSDRIKEIFSG